MKVHGPLLLLLLCISVFCLSHIASAQLPQQEQDALAQMCTQWTGLPSSWSANDTANACLWSGVTCNAPSNTSVIGLNLFGVKGALFEGLGDFTELEYFGSNVCDFQKTPIPSSFGALSSLSILSIGKSNVSGPIPDLSQSSLTVLDLSRNPLNDAFPMWIFTLSDMGVVYLHGSGLTGVLPEGQTFENGDSIKAFSIANNNLEGFIPTEIAMGKNVKNFFVDGNDFDCLPNTQETFDFGDKCSAIACDYSQDKTCTEWINPFDQNILTNLIQSWNADCLPSTWSINNVSLACDIPFEGIKCENYRINSISLNGLLSPYCSLGPLSSQIFALPELTELTLDGLGLTGSLPADLKNNKLQTLSLNKNLLSGSIPLIGPALTSLVLSNNNFTGSISASTFESSKLSIIEITNNTLSGDLSGFRSFKTFPNHFNFTSNYFTGSLDLLDFSTMAQCPCVFSLVDNLLTGTIPKELMSIPFQNIYLDRNRLTGTIPFDSISSDSPLPTLSLTNNSLTGTIQMQAYWPYYVYLDNNQLEGSLPEPFFPWSVESGASQLIHFTIRNNNISGTFPPSFENNTHIQILRLDDNPLLQGTFPSNMIQVDHYIRILTFSNTSLVCPDEWSTWSASTINSCVFQPPPGPPPPGPAPDGNGGSSKDDDSGLDASYYVAIGLSVAIILLSLAICGAGIFYFWYKSRTNGYEPVNLS